MRVLFLTQWYQPEPFFKGLPFAKALVERGHDVEVLTGFPNYPGGKIYPGYSVRPWQREMMEGIPVIRVALYPSHNSSGVERIANYVSFGISALFAGPWLVKRPDVIYVYNLVTLGWAAYFLRALYGCKVIYDVLDLWPESVANSGMMRNPWALRLLEWWCHRVYRAADRITVLSPGFRQALVDRGMEPGRIEVIYNWCDEVVLGREERDEALVRELGLQDTFNIMFAGTMGIMQGLDTVLDAARLCRDRVPSARFVLVGGGIDCARLQLRVQSEGLANVIFMPPQPPADMGRIYGLAHALLVHLKDDPLFRITIPSKTQACMAAGIPIIMAMRGDAADLVRQSGGGVVCDPENPEAVVVAVEALIALSETERYNMGRLGQQYYQENLSFNHGVGRFLQTMDACAKTE